MTLVAMMAHRTMSVIPCPTRGVVAAACAWAAIQMASGEGVTRLSPVVIGGLAALVGFVTTILVARKEARVLRCASCGQPIHDDEGYRFDPEGRVFHLRCPA